jgi:hypothetical protein
LSLPYFPSTSGLKPSELHIYTLEECQSCKEKTKRDFKVGDYIVGAAGTCEKCQGQKTIVLIYGEKAAKPPTRGIHIDLGRGPKNTQMRGALVVSAVISITSGWKASDSVRLQ